MSESELEIFCTLMRMTSATQSRPKSTVFKTSSQIVSFENNICQGPIAQFISTKDIDLNDKDMCG